MIGDLNAAFLKQRKAFGADRTPSLQQRARRVQSLMQMMLGNRARIRDALASDFGAHPGPAGDLIEVLGVLNRANYVLGQLEDWMRPQPRHIDEASLGSARAYIQLQPKGVIGNIVPWNFPFDLSVGPMIEMLAAGNRVIVKPSEYTPACAALLADMVAAAFDPDLVHVAMGDVELAKAFSALPWDHLLYTGSPAIGRQVMQAAAANLTSVTLELGGKCPALLTPGAVTARNVASIVGTKLVKNGQMCVSVDYCLVPRPDMQNFVDLAKDFMHEAAPDYARGADCTGIISPRHQQRIEHLLAEAQAHQSRIVTLGGPAPDDATRRMPLSLVIDPPAALRLMQEEIFGPILPVVPYDSLDEAVSSINAGERPLGLYVFGEDQAAIDHVLDNTSSGGAAVNTCAMQSALPSLAFGGTGNSGMGRHHGIEGFREFSNPRGYFTRGTGDMIDIFYPPYAKAASVVDAVLGR